MPHSRALSGGLFELRPKGLKGTGRVFYCFLQGKRVIMLHCFVKKTRETRAVKLLLGKMGTELFSVSRQRHQLQEGGRAGAWIVYLYLGFVVGYYRYDYGSVRLVRGGQ